MGRRRIGVLSIGRGEIGHALLVGAPPLVISTDYGVAVNGGWHEGRGVGHEEMYQVLRTQSDRARPCEARGSFRFG
jgi:hypothetical protein